MNDVTLLGNITGDLEVLKSSNDKEFMRFNIAVKRGYKSKDGEYEVDFINCIAWGKTATNIAKFFEKGSEILIKGSINVSQYTDKEGNNRQGVNVNIAKFFFTRSVTAENANNKNNSDDELLSADGIDDPF